MTRGRSAMVVALAIGAGCAPAASRPRAAPAPVSAPAAPAAPSGPCVADELGALRTELPRIDACVAGRGPCRAACEDGEPVACWELAALLQPDPATTAEAEALFRRGCALGLANACTNHAAYLWARSSAPADQQCAATLFERTCAVGDHYGCGMVGRLMVEQGDSDEERVRGKGVLMSKCRELRGFPCRVLALLSERGAFGPHDPGIVAPLLQRACEGGDPGGCGTHATVEETFDRR